MFDAKRGLNGYPGCWVLSEDFGSREESRRPGWSFVQDGRNIPTRLGVDVGLGIVAA